MKPAEIYDKHPHADAYRVGGFYSPYCLVSRDKRFSEAELAAECWKLMSGLYDGHGKVARMRRDTLYRFAALPHASDSDYE